MARGFYIILRSDCCDDIHGGAVPSAVFADKGKLIGVFQTVAVLFVPAGGGHIGTVDDRAGAAVVTDLVEVFVSQVFVLRGSPGSPYHGLLGSRNIFVKIGAGQNTVEQIVKPGCVVRVCRIIHIGVEENLGRRPQQLFHFGVVRIEKGKSVSGTDDRRYVLSGRVFRSYRRCRVQAVQFINVGVAGGFLGIDVKALQNAQG